MANRLASFRLSVHGNRGGANLGVGAAGERSHTFETVTDPKKAIDSSVKIALTLAASHLETLDTPSTRCDLSGLGLPVFNNLPRIRFRPNFGSSNAQWITREEKRR